MSVNQGLIKEDEMIVSLNFKKYSQLSNNLKHLVSSLFGAVDENDVITCTKVEDFQKPDFLIKCNDKTRYVSMKSGKALIVHNETFDSFISFLKEKNISEKTLETIALFHYGDGTVDGHNEENRKPYEELVYELKDRIKEANKELNKDIDFILEVVNRCVFKGSKKDNIEADCVYVGDREYGVLATKKQFVKNIYRRGFDYFTHLHIGPLLFRPHSRYINRKIEDQRNRNRIVASWPHLREDIEYMSKRYNYL